MNIKGIIKAHGYTLEQVASKMPNSRTGEVGISKQTMTQVVGGNPQVSTLHSIAEIIGCDVMDFFKDEATHQPEREDFIAIVRVDGETRTFESRSALKDYAATL